MTVEEVPASTARQLAAALDDTAGVHVGALFAGEFPAEAIAALGAGRLLLLDGQGLVRAPRPARSAARSDDLADALEHVDVPKLAGGRRQRSGAVTREALAAWACPGGDRHLRRVRGRGAGRRAVRARPPSRSSSPATPPEQGTGSRSATSRPASTGWLHSRLRVRGALVGELLRSGAT